MINKNMRPENARMQAFLAYRQIECRVKYIADGSLKGCWRLFNPKMIWSKALAYRLNDMGFVGFDGCALDEYSGNGGVFSVFVRGHNELLQVSVPQQILTSEQWEAAQACHKELDELLGFLAQYPHHNSVDISGYEQAAHNALAAWKKALGANR